LGNHTKKIVKYSEKCASENRQALIRVDGPYGNLSFNYRRYGSLVLVGGGIGITPIISIVKDIYEEGEVNRVKKKPHCMNNVHFIWTMPFEADAALFLDQLLIYRELSIHDPSLPLLNVSIHVTREESTRDNTIGPIFYSKPEFPLVMDDIKRKAEITGSSSILVFACGPGRSVLCFPYFPPKLSALLIFIDFTPCTTKHSMVNRVWDASMKKNSKHVRVDFHHESFSY
jgi:NAD(P)H-flavin reductase